MPDKIEVELGQNQRVTALHYPAAQRNRSGVTMILGHGAGAGQTSGFMTKFATELAARGMNVVMFNFLYAELGRRVPGANKTLEACFRAVIETVREKKIGLCTLVIGGKSMGGRIASQIAAGGVADVDGLIFLGYPLHPPGKAEELRSKHLPDIKVPMLFVQGARDAFGTPDELRPVIKTLKVPAELYVVEGGDHSFKISKRADVTQEETYKAVLDRIELWLRQTFAA